MCEVAAFSQGHAHHRVAGIHEGIIDSQIGCCTRQWLDIGKDSIGRIVLGGETLGRTPTSEGFYDVSEFGPFVEPTICIPAIAGHLHI